MRCIALFSGAPEAEKGRAFLATKGHIRRGLKATKGHNYRGLTLNTHVPAPLTVLLCLRLYRDVKACHASALHPSIREDKNTVLESRLEPQTRWILI